MDDGIRRSDQVGWHRLRRDAAETTRTCLDAERAAVHTKDAARSGENFQVSARGGLRYAEKFRELAHPHAALGLNARKDYRVTLCRKHPFLVSKSRSAVATWICTTKATSGIVTGGDAARTKADSVRAASALIRTAGRRTA
jgi:hypothetical protein